jgi:uncharacterized protein (DUF362 family)
MKSKVIRVKSSQIKGEPQENARGHVGEMLSAALKNLYDTEEPAAALKKIFPPKSRIGLKPNCAAGRKMSSSPIITMALIDLLKFADIKEEDIYVWERSERELKRTGYVINRRGNGFRVVGNDSPGVGYGRNFSQFGTVGSLVTRVLTEMVDFNINLPVMKDHSIAGISGALKNLYGAVHNPNKYHDYNCDPYAADLNSLPEIKDKNRLNIMDCFKIQYNAGPGYSSKYAIDSNMILVSDDPVALDVITTEMIDELRKEHGLDNLKDAGRYPSYLKTAADDKHKLGNCNRELIGLIGVTV